MERMFEGARNFNADLSSWDVSGVTTTKLMFWRATTFNQPLDSWNVSSVTDMSHMFRSASAFNQPLASWDVSRVTDMANMFRLASAFNQPLASWDVSRVTNMANMFDGASQFNQPLNDWDTSRVTNMLYIFDNSPFSQNLGNWLTGIDSTMIRQSNIPGVVGTVSLPTPALSNHRNVAVTYGIGTGADSDSFNITGNKPIHDKARHQGVLRRQHHINVCWTLLRLCRQQLPRLQHIP